MTVGELRERMSHAEFVHWAALYRMDPWGEVRGDLRHAEWCALFANAHRDRKKQPHAFRARDFMLFGRDESDNAVSNKAAAKRLREQFRAMGKGK